MELNDLSDRAPVTGEWAVMDSGLNRAHLSFSDDIIETLITQPCGGDTAAVLTRPVSQ